MDTTKLPCVASPKPSGFSARCCLRKTAGRTAVHLSVILGLFSETARNHGDPEQAVAAAREAIDLEVARDR